MTSRFVRNAVTLAIMVTSSFISFVPASNAQVRLRATLVHVAGEDPSAPGAAAAATGSARFVPPDLLRVTLTGMDPARFPADPSCNAEARVAGLSAAGLHPVLVPVANPENIFGVPVTMVDLRGAGVARPGDTAQVRVRCQFVDANGVRQRHETIYSGTLQ